MTGRLQPLDEKFAIVGPDGRPTLYFTRWAQQRQIDIGEAVTAAAALEIVEQFLTDHPLIAGSGIGLSPSGDIGSNVTISADVQAILDQISTTRGTVLFRGASDWQGLAPGTLGHFLQTNGAGADPVWAAGGGGGGGGSTPTVRASNSQSSSNNTYTVTWPTGTIAGDLVVIICGHGWNAVRPTGWSELNNDTGSNWNGAVFAKEMTAADITAGSVTITFGGSFNGFLSAVTITGTTVDRVRTVSALRSGSGASSVDFISASDFSSIDLVLLFATNRAASNNTFSGTSTAIQSLNATDGSGAVVSITGAAVSKAGVVNTISFSTAGSGYHLGAIAFVGA